MRILKTRLTSLTKRFGALVSGTLAAFLLLLNFTSCEVGLGPAVDTQPPTITIDKPEVDMVIRQKFVINGTWTDDGTIDGVTIKLKRTDGKPLHGTEKERTITGSFEKSLEIKDSGTWKAEIDPLEEGNEITDGTYQATVVIKDKGRHTTTQSTTFTIDNTAPVLILSKPNSTPNDKTMSAYGQRLFLEGNIADSTKDTWIEINFYSDENCTEESLLTTLETGLIAPTDVNSNNARLAVFNADLTQELAKEYNEIYGKTTKDGGPKTVYSKVTVYDTAELCTEDDQAQPTSKNGKIKGNASQSFYITKTLAESISKSQEKGGYGLAPIDIYNVLNGTYALKNESRAATVTDIITELNKPALKKDVAVFKIDPANSPYFTVSGLKTIVPEDFKKSDGYTIVNGTQTLEISVFMGSDSISLKDDENFYVYLLECDDNGNIPDGYDIEENRIKLYSKYDETGSGKDKKIYYAIGGKTDHKTTSGAYVFTIPMSQKIWADPDKGSLGYEDVAIVFGHKYRIFVSGTDTEDNPIETTDPAGYGFFFTAGGAAPTADITQPKDTTVWLKKGDSLAVKGTVKSEEGEPHFMVMNGNTKIKEFALTPTGTNGVYAFDDEIPADAFDQTEPLVYSLEFLATRDETKSTYPKSVWYDVVGPEITMGNPTPLVKAGSRDGVIKDSVNGKIQFSGSIIDGFDQFKSATYHVEQNGAVVNAQGLSGSLTSNFNFEIDTTKLIDKKDATIVITAYDRAGNETVGKYTYYVDQATDKPVISSTSAEIDGGLSETVIEQDRNLFIRGGTLVLSVADDDSVKEAEVSLQRKKDDGSFEAIDYEDGAVTGTRTFYNKYEVPSVISHTLPNTVGVYKATVTVYDNNYVSAAATPNNVSEKIFMIRITGTGPDVTVEYEKEYISTRNAAGTNKVTFKVTGAPTDRYKLYVNNELKGSDLSSPFEHTLSFAQGTTDVDEITFKVTNNQGFTEKYYKPIFDNDLPSITFNSAPTQDGQTEDATFLFKGGMGDETSRVEKVYIKFINGNTVSDIDAAKEDTTGWTECVCGSATWNSEVVWADNSIFAQEGQKTAIAKAVDLAGNEQFTSVSFKYDKIKPSITAITGNTTTKGEDVVLTISIKDTNPVAPLVTVTGYNGTITATTPAGSGDTWTSTVTIPFAATLTTDKEYEIQVTAKDANGRTAANPQKVYIIRDSVAPAISFTSPASASAAFIRKNSYKFEGTVTDTNEITKAEITLYKKASGANPDEKIGDTETISLNSNGTWSWQFYELDPATYYVKVYAKDIAGNETTTNSNSVNVDNNPPLVTLSHTGLKDASGNAITGQLSSGTTYYANGDYTILGVVSDLNFEYSTQLVEITSSPSQSLTVTSSATDKFSFKPASYTDGNFTYTIKVHDKAGNNADEITIRVWLDETGPTVTIKNPKEDITDSTKALDDDSYTFRINATDGSGVGVAKLYYAFSQNASAPAAGEWKQETFADGDKNIDMSFVAGTTTGTAPYTTQLCEGTWYLYAKAIDKSGNETTSIAKRVFPIDKAKPTLTVTDLSESDVNPLYAEISGGGYTISGTVKDTNGLAASNAVVVSVDNQTAQAATVTGTDEDEERPWSYKILTGETAGKLKSNEPVVVKVTAKDKAGKTTSKSYTLYYDTQDPELTVTAPVENESVATDTKEIKGTVSDGGYGIKELEYKLYKGTSSTPIDSGSNLGTNPKVIIKGEQWYISGTGKISLGSGEGALRLVVTATEDTTATAVDGRQYKTTKEIPFYYDVAAPGLTETGIGTTGATTNASFILKGKVWDSNELDRIVIQADSKTWTLNGTNNSTAMTLTKSQTEPTGNTTNWSATFVTGSANSSANNYISDGTKEFVITAYDIAGKEKQLSRTVIIDTTKPTVKTITVDSTGGTTIGSDIWYKTTSVPVTVAVSDSGTGSAFSAGISKVEYQAGSGSYAPLSKVGDNYEGTVNFSGNGTQTLNLKVTDVAGNVSDVKSTTVHIDTTAPSLSALYYKKDTGSAEAIGASIYVKSNTQLTVYGNYEDAESGINALTFAYGSPTVTYSDTAIGNTAPTDSNYSIAANAIAGKETSIKSWKAVFTPSASGAFTVSGSNRTTNPTGTLKVFDVTVDGDKPVVDNVKLIEVTAGNEKQAYSDGSKYFVNNTTTGKTFKISGVATDTVGVDSVALLITKNGTSTTKTATRKGSLGQWYFEGIDLSAWDGTGASVKLTVKDKAGNEADENVEFDIAFDVTAPATTHLIDDSLKNLEFRIGDAPNDAGEGGSQDPKDLDVGKKYSDGSYGSALTMQLRGNFPDETGGSGINKFYYKTFNNQEVKIDSEKDNEYEENGQIFFKDDAALIAYVVAKKTDVFSPITVETKNVEYNMTPADPVTNTTGRFGDSPELVNGYTVNSKGYVQFRTSVSTNFKTTMKGFQEGKNYLVIVAEDNAGNLGLDTATVGGVEYPCYSLNVDITAPTIPTKQDDTIYTNLEETSGVVISGTVSDMPNVANGSSGLSKIIITRDGGTGSVEVTNFTAVTAAERAAAKDVDEAYETDATLKHWEANVKSLLPSTGMAIISAKVVDNAGFETSLPVANITVDKTPPVVAINSPAANAILGKTFTISGTANDGNGAGVNTTEGLKLYYKVGSGSWTEYGTAPALTGQNWTCSVNASGFVSNGTNTAVSFKVSAKDKSGTGNTGESDALAVTVDTKVPDAGTFKVEETLAANLGSTWFNSTTVNINGTFTDAGGSGVKKVYYQVNSGEEQSVTSDGSFTINIKDLAEGSNTIKVCAEDSVGNKSTATSYTVKVDDKAPSISANYPGVVYADSSSCPVELTVTDEGGSTIDKVMLTVGDKAPVQCTLSDDKYTYDIKPLLVDGTVSVTATASDKAGNTASKVIANVMLDTTAPTVVINTPAADAKTSNSISVTGSASDGVGSGINTTKGITLYYTKSDTAGAKKPGTDNTSAIGTNVASQWVAYGTKMTLNTTSQTWSGTFAVPNEVAANNNNTTLYISVGAVDNAGDNGNAGYSTPVMVTVDRKLPEYDISYTQLSIGGKTHAQMKATPTPWFKDDTLVVKGKFKDEGGSGVTKIFYQVDSNPVVELATTDGTYNTNIPGFGANSTLTIWAEDAVGNSTVNAKTSYTIKVDGTLPTITSDISGINYSNGSTAFPVSLTVSDDASGIATVVLSRDGTTSTVSCTSSNGKYTTSDISSLLPASGNVTIMATATDKAGNTASTVAANILVDQTEPSVTLTAPADADTSTGAAGVQVNGTISLSGTASDENVIKRVVGLLYKNATSAEKPEKQTDFSATAALSSWTAPSGWTKVAATLSNANATTNWTFNGVDTAKLDGTNALTENSSIWFTVAVQDTAGNIGYSTPVQVYAKQDSDRPTITLSQLTKNTYTGTQLNAASVTTLKTKNVYGSVTDDDGTLEKLWYWNGAIAPTTAPSYTTTWVVPTGWNEITINGGSWSIDSTENDGQTTWYFAVADADKTVFATVGTDTLKLPYIKYAGETEKVSGTAKGVTFKYDTNPPTATELYLYKAAAGTATTAAELAEDDSAIAWSQTQNLAFGKDYNVLYAKVVVNESTGMKALTDAVPMSSPISISYTALEFSQIAEVVGTGTATGSYTYYLGPLTMNTTEQHEFKVTVEDAVGNKGYISRGIIVDNTAPTSITEVKPKSTVEISDVFTYRGNVSDNTGGSGVTKVEWYIPQSTEYAGGATSVAATAWKQTSLSAGWEIDFSGDNFLSNIIGYNDQTSQVGNGFKNYETSSGSDVYLIPIWFKITDAVGNVGYNETNAIRYNPNTDKPSVQITSPVHNKTATISGNSINYAIMGGTSARISGNADDNEGIEEVYLQFDLDGDGKWDNGVATLDGTTPLTADLNALPGSSATLIEGCPWTKADIKEIKKENGTSTGYFGIKVSGTKNWSYTLNLSSTALPHITETKDGEEPNVTYTYEGNTIKVRAIALDNDTDNAQYVSAPSAVINISVNNGIPLFSNLKVKQIDDSNNVLSEDDYTDGKYLTGNNWYITGDVYAYGGISSASYTGVNDAKSRFTAKTGSTFTFDMKIPITPDATGKWDSMITVYDNNDSGPQPNQQRIIIHIDNDAPTFNDSYTDDDDIDAYGTAKHFLNSYGTARGTLLTPTIKIQDTNGLASIWGRVTDTGSGFDKAVFYFKRFDIDGESNPRIYNPMEQNNNRTNIESSASAGKVYINANELPALVVETNATAKMTVTRPVENDCTIQVTLGAGATVSGVAGNKNVRKGGLIKIGGKYRTITDVDYTNGIVTFDPPCDRSFDTAEIIYAMVVDSTGETMTGNTINEEDGDGMQENFSDVSGTVTWNAAIKTSYIPDGPLELHVVAFDVAGNISDAYTKTGVNNNPLRLTKVMLGTDLNADNSYSTSEYETFYAITTSRGEHDLASGVERWDLDTRPNETSQYFTVKKGLSVIPEFVGGTGDVYYKFKKGTTDLTEAETLTTAELDTNKLSETSVAVEGAGNKIGQFSLASDTIGYGTDNADEDKMHIFSFSFWDSTESSTAGQNSSWTVLNAKIHQDLKDGVAPTGNITPFYWNSKTENSVVWSGSGSSATALGHIELENDLPTATFKDTNKASDSATAPSGEYDRDPKVSGQIYIEGAAFDETRLDSITVTFANKSVTADYSPGSGWSQAANGYGTITITDAGPAQSGHSVTWKWLVNTAEVVTDKVADIDKTITVSVKDANPNTSAASTTQTTSNTATAYYRVDIVPYITKLYTGISDSAGEEFARSATGKYILRENETVKMYGFNLKIADDTVVKVSYTTGTPTSITPTTGGSGYVNLPIGITANSGAVSITVDSIESLNNKNNNPTFTSTTDDTISAYAYNSQADGVTNNRLTDDVELWIWTTGAFDTVMNNKKTNVNSPMMKMDNSGNWYISYGNGSNLFAIDKNGTSTDLEICYNKYHNTNVAFDSNGNFYGVATNTDRVGTSRTDATSFTFFSRELGKISENTGRTDYPAGSNNTYKNGSTTRGNYYNGSNKRRLELSQYGGDNGTYNVNRVQRPKLTVSGTGTVYMAYYDSSADNVKFRYGVVSGTEELNNNKIGLKANKMSLGLEKNLEGNSATNSSASGYHLIADTADTTKFKAGAYTAVGYTSDGKAVVAWYDAKARRIVYSYNNSPGTAISTMTNNTWQTNAVYLDEAYTGWYVDLVVDAGNHVHIAYYNSKSGDLKYVYIPTYNSVSKDANGNLTGGATVVTVDSYLSVGTNITINVRDEGTGTGDDHVAKYVPYIYYYNTSNNQTKNSVKVAWQKDTTLRHGAISDKYTGAWECMTIPTENIPVDATVCGGVPTSNTYQNTVVLGYMTDEYYEKASIKGNIK